MIFFTFSRQIFKDSADSTEFHQSKKRDFDLFNPSACQYLTYNSCSIMLVE